MTHTTVKHTMSWLVIAACIAVGWYVYTAAPSFDPDSETYAMGLHSGRSIPRGDNPFFTATRDEWDDLADSVRDSYLDNWRDCDPGSIGHDEPGDYSAGIVAGMQEAASTGIIATNAGGAFTCD